MRRARVSSRCLPLNYALRHRPIYLPFGIGRLSGANGRRSRFSLFAIETDMPLVSIFMLTQALAMGVTDGRHTPRPPETSTDDAHQPVARILRACP